MRFAIVPAFVLACAGCSLPGAAAPPAGSFSATRLHVVAGRDTLDVDAATIVGVAPAAFHPSGAGELWLPASAANGVRR